MEPDMNENNENNGTNETNETNGTNETKETKEGGKEAGGIFGQDRRRRVIASPVAEVVHTASDGTVSSTESHRAVFVLLDHVNQLPDDGTYEVFVKEDEEKSEAPAEGEPRYRASMAGRAMSKPELMKWLAENYLTPAECVKEFQKLCVAMAVHSQLKNVMVTMVFDGSRPSGFTFFTDCAEQTVSDVEALGNASMRMARGYMSDMKAKHGASISFEDDGGLVLPNSVDAQKLMRSAAAARDMLKKG